MMGWDEMKRIFNVYLRDKGDNILLIGLVLAERINEFAKEDGHDRHTQSIPNATH